ncbi:MAG: Pheromone shutdown protein TraB [Methanophagales archaeon]|nr:Pheromone shutdown protein TraB [Methanophagales archaeon]
MLGGVDVEHLTDEDVVSQLLNELRQFSPGAATALLDERDAFIAGRLRSLSKMLHERAVREKAGKAGKEQTRQTQIASVEGETVRAEAVVRAGAWEKSSQSSVRGIFKAFVNTSQIQIRFLLWRICARSLLGRKFR